MALVDELKRILAITESNGGNELEILKPGLKEVRVPELFEYELDVSLKDKALKVLKEMGSDLLFAEIAGSRYHIYFYNDKWIRMRRAGDIEGLRKVWRDISSRIGGDRRTQYFSKVVRLGRSTKDLLASRGIEVIE